MYVLFLFMLRRRPGRTRAAILYGTLMSACWLKQATTLTWDTPGVRVRAFSVRTCVSTLATARLSGPRCADANVANRGGWRFRTG